MTEVDTAASGEVQQARPYERFAEHLRREAAQNDAVNGYEVSATQIDKIMTAETEKDIWDADEGGMYALKDLVGCDIEITAIKILPSKDDTKKNNLGVWALLNVTLLSESEKYGLDPGEAILVNTGVESVIAKLLRFRAEDMFPVRARVKGVPAASGEMVRLRPIPSTAVPSSAE